MKTKILRQLRTTNEYVSGQMLCDELGVSRTAVWKAINQLKEEGYTIEAVQNKGYKITGYPDILTAEEIETQLNPGDTVKKVVYAPEIDSTNNEAKRNAENGAKDGTLYITESQTGGRGRRGRQWVSPSGSGIWMTLLLRPQINPANASMLTIVAAMAVTMAIRRAVAETGADVECHIKWPNDVVINKKKVCGILTEMSAELDCIHYVVIGIGINVNTTEFADEIKETASSLFVETGKNIKRSRIVALFAEEFTKYYQKFLNTGDLSGLVQDYNEMLINMDMFNENVVLCASSAYEKKFYLNEAFDKLPEDIKNELKIMCVLFTEEVGGILTLEFDENGTLLFKTEADENDLLYDDIACGMLIKKLQYEKRDLLESMEMFYRVFFLGE